MDAEEQAEIQSRIHSLDETGAAGLRDWTAIRVHLKRHDDEMIGDYSDDINTMLVFAGLFSAVVTAFIIDSYKWLQADNSQTTVQLLAQISSQLSNQAATMAHVVAVNPTPTLAVSVPPFEVSTSSIWINCLWVLSLLFSLTAALLGIIIKQWLREYLLWDSVLFPSREAVLLRHIRYDAWERWKVPVIISLIPAMLELALVEFLCGAAILLWTLNATVAIVVTFFGSLAFITACAVNILPVFFHRCPYKSAVGWTCVSAWNLATRWSRRALNRWNSKLHLRDIHKRGPKHSESWRQRDLERNMQWGIPIQWEHHPEMSTEMQLETVELVILFHALAWVCSSTQDNRLLAKVQQCASKFHGTSRKHLCLVAGMHAVCQIFYLDPGPFFRTIRSEYKRQIVGGTANTTIGTYILVPRTQSFNVDVWQGHPPDQAVLQMVADVMLNVLQICIDDMFPTLLTTASLPAPEHVAALMETLCFLVHISRRASPIWRDDFLTLLIGFWNNLRTGELGGPWKMRENGPQYPGFKGTVFQLLARLGTVHIGSSGDLRVDQLETPVPGHYAEMAMRIFDNNPEYKRPEDRHLFVLVANDAIRDSSQVDDQPGIHSLRDLFSCMDEAVEISTSQELRNCGFHGDLPWLDSLLTFSKRADPALLELVPMALVDHLEGSIQAGLVAGEAASQRISQLRSQLSNPQKYPPDSPQSVRSPRSIRSPYLDSPEQTYFSRRRSTSYGHKADLSSSSSTHPLMPSVHSPTLLTSWHEDGPDRPVELGTMPFPTPSTPDVGPVFAFHSRGSTWPN